MDKTLIKEFFHWKRTNMIVFPESFKRALRKELKRPADPLEKSVLDPGCWRIIVDKRSCKNWYEYTIIEDHGETDEQLDHIFSRMQENPMLLADCSGKPFTRYIYWQRVRCGIVVIHAKAFAY